MNNKYKKIAKKVGGIRVESQKSKVQSHGLRLRAAGLIIFTMAVVWAAMPANGVEAATGDG